MRTVARPLLIMLAMVALLLIFHQGRGLSSMLPGANSYLDDFFCLPLVMGGILVVLRLVRHDPVWTLPLRLGLFTLTLYALYFEWILPRFTGKAVSDPWDVLAYGVGFLVFKTVINRPAPAG